MDLEQLSDILYSSSEFLSFSFEREFTFQKSSDFARTHTALPVVLAAIYLLFCFFGSSIMASRRAFDLRVPLACWNAILCIFSFIGMCRTVPFLLASIFSNDFETTVCAAPKWDSGVTGFWAVLFIFSKIPALLDTVFVVLRRKPLIFLHWYNHITVLLFAWNMLATKSTSGLYFIAMNYTVHALMYGYYCLQALNSCPKNFPAFLITFAQVAQMLIGAGICLSAWYFRLSGHSCHNHRSNLMAGALIYGTYIYLFIDFSIKGQPVPKRRLPKVLKAV